MLWILTDKKPKTFRHDGEGEEVYRIKKWEKFLHEMYFDRLYYWQQQAYIIPYHLKPFSTWVDESEWYDENGDSRQEGGFYRETKTLKIPIPFPGSILHLAEDFTAKPRRESRFEYQNIPQSRLWVDTKSIWWRY